METPKTPQEITRKLDQLSEEKFNLENQCDQEAQRLVGENKSTGQISPVLNFYRQQILILQTRIEMLEWTLGKEIKNP